MAGKSKSSLCAPVLLLAWILGCGEAPVYHGEAPEEPAPAPEVAGRNYDGEPFRLSGLRGKVVVVSFGYTFCPDVCPFTLWKMKELFARLEERAGEAAYVLVSVDPQRDTLAKLAEYVPAFDPRFFGVRLEDEELETVVEDWELTVRHVPFQNPANLDGSYNVDHTGTYFVLDRQGQVRLHFSPKSTVDEMLADLLVLLAEER